MSRILVAVTHLLGAGHLTRAAALARAFAGAGHAVTLVSGGMPAALPGLDRVRRVQLPPVRILGTAFTDLRDEAGDPVGADRLAARRDGLLAALAQAQPDAVVTELYPFGRRVLSDEFEALIAAARARTPRPLILASIRDILARPGRPERIAASEARIAQAYDSVLVHGDPTLLPLDASWPVSPALRARLRYTGYVDEAPQATPVPPERAGLVVSGGSSAAGLPLQRAALGAAALRPDRPWRILVGRGVPEADFAALRAAAPANAVVERARPDFRALLAGADLSVSQAGYNTVLDLLATGIRAVLVPFEAGGETEQRLRAATLAEGGLARVLPEPGLTAAGLAAAVTASLAAPAPPAPRRRLDGTPLAAALARLEAAGARVTLWWRDDDAVAHTAALDRLLALAAATGWPVALAAVPARAEPSLAERLAEESTVDLLVHGLAHADHAPPGAKKAELGPHRPLAAIEADLARAMDLARARLARPGRPPLPVLVPPWNRIAPAAVAALPGLGFAGVSTFGPRGPARPGLGEIHTHIDPIAWREPPGPDGLRRLADPAALLARTADTLRAAAESGEPVGLLTHHLVQDEATWAFCAALLVRLAASPAVRIARAAALFGGEPGGS
ncbi:glycosyltransferase [Methylobacterium oryzihabitans]|uniref:Glycosyl transferase family 28 n=1 Tax=Methylobacterium oryzihabitans TaxID=2499852 RepID=A0A3S2VUF8_9HYPH|nr:glycosyltransferase [Methylobacterium oryzihabitans]RVU17800.1 glycosyl transferase family 28 [Methylobacterium oryzihabitans]